MDEKQLAMSLTDVVTRLQKVIDLLEDDNPPDVYAIPPVPFKDEPEFVIPKEWIDDWVNTYNVRFVYDELMKLRQWCLDNPFKQKYSKDHYVAGRKVKPSPRGFFGNNLSRAWDERGNRKLAKVNTKKYTHKKHKK